MRSAFLTHTKLPFPTHILTCMHGTTGNCRGRKLSQMENKTLWRKVSQIAATKRCHTPKFHGENFHKQTQNHKICETLESFPLNARHIVHHFKEILIIAVAILSVWQYNPPTRNPTNEVCFFDPYKTTISYSHTHMYARYNGKLSREKTFTNGK